MQGRAGVIIAVVALVLGGTVGGGTEPTETRAMPATLVADTTHGSAQAGHRSHSLAATKGKKKRRACTARTKAPRKRSKVVVISGKAKKKPRRCVRIVRTNPAAPGLPSQPTGEPTRGVDYEFGRTNADGSPARWNPCEPITWRFNPQGAPSYALADVTTALATVTAASGLTFAYAGTTTDRPFRHGAEHPDGEDLLIGFGTPAEYPDRLSGTTVGSAGPWSSAPVVDGVRGPWELVAGDVLLSATHGLPAGHKAGPSFGNLVLHELGHALGLAHVDAPQQLMSPTLSLVSPAGLGAGDRAGLRQLGSAAGCVAEPLR
jgi:hypothetical protein